MSSLAIPVAIPSQNTVASGSVADHQFPPPQEWARNTDLLPSSPRAFRHDGKASLLRDCVPSPNISSLFIFGLFMSGKSCGCFCWYDLEIPTYCQKTIKRLQHSIDKLKVEVEKIQASMDIQTLNHRLEIKAEKCKKQLEKATYVLTISLS